jgi:hypothetical protein
MIETSENSNMVQTIKERVTVEAGGVIRLRRPELREGTIAEVFVVVDGAVGASTVPEITELFGKAKGSFASSEEADAFLRSERDAWDE